MVATISFSNFFCYKQVQKSPLNVFIKLFSQQQSQYFCQTENTLDLNFQSMSLIVYGLIDNSSEDILTKCEHERFQNTYLQLVEHWNVHHHFVEQKHQQLSLEVLMYVTMIALVFFVDNFHLCLNVLQPYPAHQEQVQAV